MARTTVVHLVHSNDVGGVETAVARLQSAFAQDPTLDYQLYALADTVHGSMQAFTPAFTGGGLNSPYSFARLVRQLRAVKPDVLVTSLWRSTLVGLAARLPSTTAWAVYLHNTRWTNRADALAHRLCWNRANAIFADSEAATQLVPASQRERITVIRPVAAPLAVESVAPLSKPVRLVFWGRLVEQKRLDRAVDLLAILLRDRPGAFTLELIGPDGGQWERVQTRAKRAGVLPALIYTGPLDRPALAKRAAQCHMFVQLSDFEGLGMSAAEAAAAGLIPVVTPVGDVGITTADGHGAIHVGTATGSSVHVTQADLHQAAKRICALSDDPAAFATARMQAQRTTLPDFVSDFRTSVLSLAGAATCA